MQRLIAPAVVIDCSKEAAEDNLFVFELEHIENVGEALWSYSRMAHGCSCARTGRSGKTLRNSSILWRTVLIIPGPARAAIEFLIEQRNVNGWGVEAVGTDAGQAFAFEPAFPAHALMHAANRFGLASLCNLDQLPPTGAVLITPPLKIEKGSGSPLRVLALVAS